MVSRGEGNEKNRFYRIRFVHCEFSTYWLDTIYVSCGVRDRK